jgi:hypothetical protein
VLNGVCVAWVGGVTVNEKDGADAAGGGVVRVLMEFSVGLRIVEVAIVVAAIEVLVSALANWCRRGVASPIVALSVVAIDAEGRSANPSSPSSSESPRTNKLDSF